MASVHLDGFTSSMPAGPLDLPVGFDIEVLARSGDPLPGGAGLVPGRPGGVGAFPGIGGVRLVQNHDQGAWGEPAATAPAALTYDPVGAGGVTTFALDERGRVVEHQVSLGGTLCNGAGAATPWHTWLTGEQTEQRAVGRHAADHGWIFELDPVDGRNNLHPEPVTAMGRFAHLGPAVDPERGDVYLPEAGRDPNGLLHRFRPARRPVGYGDLREGGTLEALAVDGLRDAGVATEIGLRLPVRWVPVPDPLARRLSTRKQFDHVVEPTGTQARGEGGAVTRWPRLERVRWTAGRLWIVCGRTIGTLDGSDGKHGGQVWSLDPAASTLELALVRPVHDVAGGCPVCVAASNCGPTATALSSDSSVLYAGIPDAGLTIAVRGPFEDHH